VTHEDGTAAVVLSEKEKCTSVGSTTSSGIKRHRMAHYIRQHLDVDGGVSLERR
jgi:hypothetical protein